MYVCIYIYIYIYIYYATPKSGAATALTALLRLVSAKSPMPPTMPMAACTQISTPTLPAKRARTRLQQLLLLAVISLLLRDKITTRSNITLLLPNHGFSLLIAGVPDTALPVGGDTGVHDWNGAPELLSDNICHGLGRGEDAEGGGAFLKILGEGFNLSLSETSPSPTL